MTCRDPHLISLATSEARLRDMLKDSATFEDLILRQNEPALALDQKELRKTTRILNSVLRSADFSDRPHLRERFTKGPLLASEIGSWAVEYGYSELPVLNKSLESEITIIENKNAAGTALPPANISPISNVSKDIASLYVSASPDSGNIIANLVTQLNLFFAGDFIFFRTSAMCSLFSEAITTTDNAGKVVGKAYDTLADIQNINLSDLSSDVAPLENLNNVLDDVIDDITDQLSDRALRIKNGTISALRDIHQLTIGSAIDIGKKHNRINRLLDTKNRENMKKQNAKYLVDGVTQFEDVGDNANIITYLAHRTCQALGQTQAVFEGPVASFGEDMNRRVAFGDASARELNFNRAKLHVNGGPNLSVQDISIAKTIAYKNLAGQSSGGVRTSTPPGYVKRAQPADDAALQTVLRASTIRTRPRSAPPIRSPISPEDVVLGNTFEIRRSKSGRYTKVFNRYINMLPHVMNEGIDYPHYNDDDGWTMVDPKVWAMIWRLGEILDTQLVINSAYRSPTKNSAVGGVFNSFHKQGLAVDINTIQENFTSIELIRHASLLGFGGIGGYRNFIHVDARPKPAYWNLSNSAEINQALLIHTSDTLTFDKV